MNRKKAEKYIMKSIMLLTNNSEINKKHYEDIFKDMSNKEFDQFMKDLEEGKENLAIIVPHYSKEMQTNEKLMSIADKLGIKFEHRLTVVHEDGTKEKKPITTMVLDVPIFRTRQLLTKGISAADKFTSRNQLTGQVTNESKSSKLSLQQAQILSGLGLKNVLLELEKARGGDMGMEYAMDAMLTKYGKFNMRDAIQYESGVVSKNTVEKYFKAMMVKLKM